MAKSVSYTHLGDEKQIFRIPEQNRKIEIISLFFELLEELIIKRRGMMKELLKSRKKIGITIGVGIIIFLALYLIGGGKQTKNEKEIMEDLNSDTSWFQYCELKAVSYTHLLLKRKLTSAIKCMPWSH